MSALNEFYIHELSEIVKTKSNNNIEISIVDAFGIIYPRLVFPQDYEVACGNHFVCREYSKADDKWHEIYTPGGEALITTVGVALWGKWGLNYNN